MLTDEGIYLGSGRTLYRLLAEQGQTTAHYQRLHHVSKKPELLATRPNTLWSWDISVLQMHGMELAMS